VKEDPPPANIQIDMHNYDSCPRCRADGEFDTVTALFTGVNMTDFTLYISPIQLESPEREPNIDINNVRRETLHANSKGILRVQETLRPCLSRVVRWSTAGWEEKY